MTQPVAKKAKVPVPTQIRADLYDYPKYYDVIFAADWRAELKFLVACFQKHATRKVKRVFEPACGTGRLLTKLHEVGLEVAGNDLNPRAVGYCNARFRRRGWKEPAIVGDMSAFTVKKPYDAGFNMINSFRHLPTEESARKHLECMAAAIAPGGLYILGLHLTPLGTPVVDEERWTARRGTLSVSSRMWTIQLDRQNRNEHLGMTFDVRMPTRRLFLEDEMHYRIYTASQMAALVKTVPAWEIVATYDFGYDIASPITVTDKSEDTVFVFRRRA